MGLLWRKKEKEIKLPGDEKGCQVQFYEEADNI